MIRRDYLLRMVDQCVAALARSLGLTKDGFFDQACQELDEAIRNLASLEPEQLAALSEAELLARLLQGEPTQMLRQKGMLLVALLREKGRVYVAQGRGAEGRVCTLKALNLALELLTREGPFDYPELVPSVETLAAELEDAALPLATRAALMRLYEQLGQFAQAEDALFAMLAVQPSPEGLAEFGRQFYQRLLHQTDTALDSGNLPRAEVEAGLAEWEVQSQTLPPS